MTRRLPSFAHLALALLVLIARTAHAETATSCTERTCANTCRQIAARLGQPVTVEAGKRKVSAACLQRLAPEGGVGDGARCVLTISGGEFARDLAARDGCLVHGRNQQCLVRKRELDTSCDVNKPTSCYAFRNEVQARIRADEAVGYPVTVQGASCTEGCDCVFNHQGTCHTSHDGALTHEPYNCALPPNEIARVSEELHAISQGTACSAGITPGSSARGLVSVLSALAALALAVSRARR